MTRNLTLYLCGLTFLAIACRNEQDSAEEPASGTTVPAPSNRVAIPPTVRNNLGITFAKVEVREVARTIRVPGCFELSPDARREHRTMASGRVELHVAQFAQVEPGQLLYTLESPDWRKLQQEINETTHALQKAEANSEAMGPLLAAHAKHHAELEHAVAVWTRRVEQLDAGNTSGVVTADDLARARGTLATARATFAETLEKDVELQLRETRAATERDAQRARLELLLNNAGSMLSLPVEQLTEPDPASPEGHPRWREIRRINVRSVAPGVVETLDVTNGTWADAGSLVMTTVQPERIRFCAMGLQADLPRLTNDPTARIAPPRSRGLGINDGVAADLRIGLDAHPDNRTITLFAEPDALRPWMRPGVSAFLEVEVETTEGKAIAIPRSAVVKDGITHVFFRRDPKDANQAIRIEADMGADDGRWVVIQSGLMRGDEVVLDGAYELRLATAQGGTVQKGGHFHADGSFHGEH